MNGQDTNSVQERGRLRKTNRFSKRQAEEIEGARGLVIKIFAGILVLGFVLGIAFFLRPTVSQVENRNLTTFPELTLETFLNGQFFSDVSLWYADTFPFREQLVSLDQVMESAFGLTGDVQMVGGTEVTDEIPEDAQPQEIETDSKEEVEAPNERVMAEEIQDSITKGLYVKNGAAYNIYYFSKESVQKYAKAINSCASELQDSATVYSILVPNNSGAMLTEQELTDLGGSDQAQAIKYFYSLYSENVVSVDILDELRNHNDEYLYFKTDHHWTQLGAYYAYLCFSQAAGLEPVDINTLETMTFEPFLGSYYQELLNDTMKNNPDYVLAYIPADTNDMKYKEQDGDKWKKSNVILDVTGWNHASLYNTFIAGDEPIEKIENPKLDDNSSVLVVKDSFGNAFVPWLVDNYQYIYVIDFRYYDGSIPEFVKNKGIQNVLFLNNISMAGTTTVAEKLQSMM